MTEILVERYCNDNNITGMLTKPEFAQTYQWTKLLRTSELGNSNWSTPYCNALALNIPKPAKISMKGKLNRMLKAYTLLPIIKYNFGDAQKIGMPVVIRTKPKTKTVNLLQQTSPTSPAKGNIKITKMGKTLIIIRRALLEKGVRSTRILIKVRQKLPVALITATAKSTNRPDLVVTQVVLYRLEKEGGQHKEAD